MMSNIREMEYAELWDYWFWLFWLSHFEWEYDDIIAADVVEGRNK